MTIFLDSDSLVLVQGMTGAEGRKHTRRMLSAGTRIVGGANPRKAGTTLTLEAEGYGPAAQRVRNGDVEVPVFGIVVEGVAATDVNATVIFVPPAFARDAVLEAIDTDIQTIVVITEGIPVADAAVLVNRALEASVRLVSPSYPGITSPGQSSVSITPADITGPGHIGLMSKSGTLTYQLMYKLHDIGFTTCPGIGRDPVMSTTHTGALEAFEADPDTGLVVMIGEIGGDAEEHAAVRTAGHTTEPAIGYVAGFTASGGKIMGHTGAIMSGSSGTTTAKAGALEAVNVKVEHTPSQTAALAH